MTLKKHVLRLTLILLLYLTLATVYSVVVPIGRGADEWAHYWYARFIAEHGRLPANPAEREMAGYKSDWPPLYHLAAAGVTAWIDPAGPPTFKYRADSLRRRLVPALGPEAILHTQDELFPWQQEILVWHLGRFLSIGFTLGTLLVTYFIALEIFIRDRVAGSKVAGVHTLIQNQKSKIKNPKTLALISVLILAFNPRFLFTGMLFNYDSLTLFIASLFLWLAIRIVKGRHSHWGFWALGALAGLGLVTKYLTVLLPLEIVIVALMVGVGRQGSAAQPGERGNQGLGGMTSPQWRWVAKRLGQAALAYLFVVSGWFAYLLVNFNEVDTYGPVLGTLAPLIRGDASDRTVEELFAWMSGGQARPVYIEKQSYTAWQIITELPTTFWSNPITRPYPLNWFVLLMTVIVGVAGLGLVRWWRASTPVQSRWFNLNALPRRLAFLLAFHCVLPLPFMLIRLFGARDALEAVQGRHILFLAGPAVAVLLVWGVSAVVSGFTFHVSRFTFQAWPGLVLVGAVSQLIFMGQVYPPLLPVQTTPYAGPASPLSPAITLPGGAQLIGYETSPIPDPYPLQPSSLKVTLIWQGGREPAPEDYQTELALVNEQGQIVSGWSAYQTQARYPTRVWEAGDVIRDEGWLPLLNVPAGDYELRLRILGQSGEVLPWQVLTTYTLVKPSPVVNPQKWTLWRNGQIVSLSPLFRERETAQFAFPPAALTGPDGVPRSPAASGSIWANFIIGPEWPPGDYRFEGDDAVALRVKPNGRNFQLPPEMMYPLEANFEGQVKLLAYHLPTRRLQPGNGLPLTLYWQGLRWLGEEFVLFNRLLDNSQVAWGGSDRLPQENYSPLLWAPGEIVTDTFAVPVAVDAPDGVYTLSLGWYRVVDGEAKSLVILNPETGEPTEATSITIGPIKVGGPPTGVTFNEVTPQTNVNVVLGEQIKLLGFDLVKQNAAAFDLTLYWQAVAQAASDYTVFVHIRDAGGAVAAQKDAPPAGGVYPTGLWDAGEIIRDEIMVPLEELKPGAYEIVIGMYDFNTGQRLPVPDSPDDAIWLQSFEIGERTK
ncbi:MAG: glycosyltransferase family 39 protein [Anaerolineae bacterium]|nr:glycosyltransferase family 39 protein [Anaerolineae bacterium]